MNFDFRHRRRALGYSIKILSKVSGVSESTIKNFESGKRMSRRETFELIVEALELSVKYEDYYEFLHVKKENSIKDTQTCKCDCEVIKNMRKRLLEVNENYKEYKPEEIQSQINNCLDEIECI